MSLPPEPNPAAIRAGAAQLGLALDERQAGQLADYAQLLQRWNAVHNLTALRSGDEILTHHLLDSLSLVPAAARLTAARRSRVLDVGSGGGLPGMVLAIAMPALALTLVDAAQKKCAFLTQAKLQLRLDNVEVRQARVESMRAEPFDLIVARAFATLARLVESTRHLLAPTGAWLAMKGQYPQAELAELSADIQVVSVVALRVPGLDEQRHLVEMRPG